MALKSIQKVRIGAITVVGLIAAYTIWWFWLRPPGPDEVAQMTARALGRGDIDTLLRLTMPEEVKKLHLTSDGVRGLLSQTFYVAGRPQTITVRLEADRPVDQRQYYLFASGPHSASVTYPLVIIVNEQPNGRWYLALSYALLTSCSMKDKNMSVQETWERFRSLAARYDIYGVRLNTWGYSCQHHLCD